MATTRERSAKKKEAPSQTHERVFFPVRCAAELDGPQAGNRSRFAGRAKPAASEIAALLCGKLWGRAAKDIVLVKDAFSVCAVRQSTPPRVEIAGDVLEALGLRLSGKQITGPAETVSGAIAVLRLAKAWSDEFRRTSDARAALRAALDAWADFPATDREACLDVLAMPPLDTGKVFSAFLRLAGDEKTRSQQGESADAWRERWITWVLGQMRIDLPYDRTAVRDILSSVDDPDESRAMLYQAIRKYDRGIEQDNAARLAEELAWAREELIFGRMSRAFHNQALLFASSRYITVTAEMVRAGARLAAAASVWPALRPAVDRVTLLLQPHMEVPHTELAGAIDHVEDVAVQQQKTYVQKVLEQERGQSSQTGATEGRTGALEAAYSSGKRILASTRAIRASLAKSPRRPAAYVVISQRPSPTGSHLVARINEGQDPFLGKPEDLRELVRYAGDRLYASPDYAWLEYANHWIEAIPLFIKERIRVDNGVEIAETVIDQEGMEESFREQMADYWERNIARTELSGMAALARALMSGEDPEGSDLSLSADLSRARKALRNGAGGQIARLTAALAIGAETNAFEISMAAESSGDRLEATRRVLFGGDAKPGLWTSVLEIRKHFADWPKAVDEALSKASENDKNRFNSLIPEAERLATIPRRPLPVLHVLTTQSARMTDGYIRTWLEESMALSRIAREYGLDADVRQRMDDYAREIEAIAESLVKELGLEPEIESIMATERVNRRAAILRLVGANRIFQKQVSLIAVLREVRGVAKGDLNAPLDSPELDAFTAEHEREISDKALAKVVERNVDEFARSIAEMGASASREDLHSLQRKVVAENSDLRADLDTFTRFESREGFFEDLSARHPDWKLKERRETWLRKHQRLALTTARKEIIAEQGLNHLTLDPRFFLEAVGGNKRYHLIYTPSRVDLGPKERESVETWSQWVGGRDKEAAQAGRRIYGLINKSVKRFNSLTEPEILKTGENASMAAHFAYSNAMALMVNAAGRGDMEQLGDEMSLRNDRIIHPAGEGYGGYCVPKDGLFLEFVLTLSERVKLRQLGIEERFHEAVSQLARKILLKREDFPCDLEWERWAEELLGREKGLQGLFSTHSGEGPGAANHRIPVFQITRLATVLEQLGQPPLHDNRAVVKSLAARWGIHTMVAGAEHVNRFMPFYKAWLIYDTIAEARRFDPSVASPEESVIVLSAEYKPDTQDGRFSVGMRKYEILAGTGDHLRYSLGYEAATLASLMFDGWSVVESRRGVDDPVLEQIASAWVGSKDDVRSALKFVFPGYGPPAEMRLVSPMGLSKHDVLRYTSDTRLEEYAEEARVALVTAGLSDEDIRAHMATFGPRLERWTRLRNRGAAELAGCLKGKVHALALAVLGPERSYEHALQGADVFDVGIPHRQVMELLNEPARLCDLMLFGKPGSALAIVDGASGARRRALNRRGVMLWFAAAENRGKRGVYRSIGLGEDTVEEWRSQMREQRQRALEYADALRAGRKAVDSAFERVITQLRSEQEASLVLEEEERLRRFSRDTERDHVVAMLLAEIVTMRSPRELTFAHWLALGGMFVLEGCSPAAFEEGYVSFEKARGKLQPGSEEPRTAAEIKRLAGLISRPLVRAYGSGFRQVGGVESSNKATEEVKHIALSTRRQLADRARRLMSARVRADSFQTTWNEPRLRHKSLEELNADVREALGEPEVFASEALLGKLVALARVFGEKLLAEICPLASPDREKASDAIAALLNEREFDVSALKGVCGSYEDIGTIGRMAQELSERAARENWTAEASDAAFEKLADFAEFVSTIHALEISLADRQRNPDEVDAPSLWRQLASYFAETLNDHFYEYRPWAYSRGVGFQRYTGDRLYALANRHFAWLYRYLRHLIVTRTEVRYLTPVQQDLLIGRISEAGVVVAVGASGDTEEEKRWRAFNQLREIAFIRNDGFPLPPTFDGFDPALIDADNRANILSMHPVGRTHVSRLVAEGPTLARELVVAGQPAANVILTRSVRVDRDSVLVDDGHLYVDKQTYVQALRDNWGLSETGAKALAERDVGPKGVRIAVRFSRPVRAAVVLPMHGNPVYDGGHLERLGLPYSVQSRFHTWTTYDKAKYPDIFTPETGVRIPAEIDWLHEWTVAGEEEEIKHQIRSGRPGTDYCGLQRFSEKYGIVMVKDAAESGGRGQKPFPLRTAVGSLNEETLSEAVDFLYQISLVHNVSVQEVVLSSPETWATEEFLERFVDRQVTEWYRPITRDRQPATPLFGSLRVIVSTDRPLAEDRYHHWHMSHRISLNSTQLITNVGRGGTLDLLRPEDIRPEFRDTILAALDDAARRTMEAMAAYEAKAGARYTLETGLPVGKDASGVSYGIPRYLMLDFLLRPVFHRKGDVVETVPRIDEKGNRIGSVFMLRDGNDVFEGEIVDWEVILIEPNIGIGLWDRVAIREEELERKRAQATGRPMDWDRVGENARVVLRDLTRAGIDYLEAKRRGST
ncbi:MAG TPA: hypothetical protein P5179_03895 [Candidatus Latescibacteria bacterium]|nr:hypothetical protein [Candidatus Latescibacterota bacterium]